MFHQVNILSIYSNHLWSKNITVFTACLNTHWTAHIKMCYFQQVAILFHLTENEAFQSSCPCGMICMSQVIQNQVSPNDPSAWSFFIPIDMVRMSQTFQKWVSPKIHQHGASSCVLNQYDLHGSATSKWYYHYYLLAWKCVSLRSRFNKPFILGARPLKVLFK